MAKRNKVGTGSLVAKLAAVRASGKTCFGAESHRFELSPPATVAEVETFEARRGVTLPDSYRRFILEAGASGAGPFYGLMPLSCWKEGLRVPRKLGIAALTLTDQGCGNYSLLVLEGPKRGRVMYANDLGDTYFPEDRNFAAWYGRWLDEILWDYDNTWFGLGMAGREADFYAALTSARVGKRVEGAAAMLRLPAITKRSHAALIRAVVKDSPKVQAAALESLAKHDRGALESLLPALLESTDNNVVLAALRHLKGSQLANKLATANDPAVVEAAIASGTLDELELVALLDGPAWKTAIMSLRQRQDGRATPRLIEMIEDPDVDRRFAALVCLRSRKDASARDALLARLTREADVRLRAEIVEGLGAMGDIEAVLGFARDADARLQFRAAYVLGTLGDARAIPVLTELSTSEHKLSGMAWSVGEQARKALAKLEAGDGER